MLGFAWNDGIGIEFCKEHARIKIKIIFYSSIFLFFRNSIYARICLGRRNRDGILQGTRSN